MESKKLSKQFSTIFWWVLYALPLIFIFIYFIGYFFIFSQTGDSSFATYLFESAFINVCDFFLTSFNWEFLYNSFLNIYDVLGISYGVVGECVAFFFSWLILMNFLHLFVDFILFIPRAFHNLMERWS